MISRTIQEEEEEEEGFLKMRIYSTTQCFGGFNNCKLAILNA
jgi:hypothetical protein